MKEDLLKRIALKGYDVAYAANLNFSTYDIVKKLPGIIAFLSIVVGLLGLVWPTSISECISVFVLILGISSIYVERFTHDVESYGDRGKRNTQELNKLKHLYYEVKEKQELDNLEMIEKQFLDIVQEFNEESQPNQILFSGVYAHYKLFYEKDISWLDEQLHFGFWKDKMPHSVKVLLFLLILCVAIYYCCAIPGLNAFFKKILFIK